MKPFHLTDERTTLWPAHLMIVAMILAAYFLGQFPLLIALGQHDLLQPETIDDTALMAETLGYNAFLSYLLIPFLCSMIALLLGMKYLLKRPILSVFTIRKKMDLKRFFLSFSIWFGTMGALLLIVINSSDQFEWNLNMATFPGLLAVSLLLIPIQTTCEELVFRGYLLQLFGAYFKKGWLSILFTGILFGLVHGSNPEVQKIGNILLVYYIATGIFLGIMAVMDDGLELSMGYHAANNIFAALIVTNDWQAFQTDALYVDHSGPSFGWDSVITIVVLQPLLILLFAKVFKWKNWKKKFFHYGTEDIRD
jgi:uncharacterized protein